MHVFIGLAYLILAGLFGFEVFKLESGDVKLAVVLALIALSQIHILKSEIDDLKKRLDRWQNKTPQ